MPESAELNLDELKRRGRRRLIGAIVLALAAAVLVPMLLESEPKPLGDDVSVRIPPVDGGKFVNRLNDSKGKSVPPKSDAPRSEAPKAEPPKVEPPKAEPPKAEPPKAEPPKADVPASEPPRAELAKAEPAKVEPAKTEPAKTDAAKAEPPKPDAQATPAPRKSLAEAEKGILAPTTKAAPAPAPAPARSPETKVPPIDTPNPAAAPTPMTPASGSYVVQLAAFADDKGANALANKLKKAGHAAYTEPLATSRGTLWRVRVGPFPTREAANAARDQLKSEGQNGIVTGK
jgi:DedD protein